VVAHGVEEGLLIFAEGGADLVVGGFEVVDLGVDGRSRWPSAAELRRRR
jgi:hypothetical protein